MEIFVKTSSGKTISLEVERSDTVEDVVARIQDEKLLIFNGEQLKKVMTLEASSIRDKSTLHLVFGMQIYVVSTNTGMNISVEVESFDTIKNVKAKIQEMKGISSSRQRLMFGGKQLSDEQTLADCCVQNKSTLDLVLHPCRQGMHVKVKTLNGKTIIFEQLESSDTIRSLKDKLYEKEGIPTESEDCIRRPAT